MTGSFLVDSCGSTVTLQNRRASARALVPSGAVTGSGEPLVPLPALLRRHAAEQPERPAFTFLLDGEHDAATLTNAQLHSRAGRVAAALRERVEPGDRVLLLQEPGLEFLASFFGCLRAGVVAVTAYPPDLSRARVTGERIESIASDASAAVVLTTRLVANIHEALAEHAPSVGALEWVASEDLHEGSGGGGAPDVDWSLDDLAFIQYTSGSTGDPKGVQLTHRNLSAQAELLHLNYDMSPDSVNVTWNPLYHDMGLLGSVVVPVAVGYHSVIMSPLSFLARPMRWLRAITRYRGTVSGGPNFAYELCVRKAREEDLDELDLSSWSPAFNGAEPIRPDTIDRFARKFERCGFRREATYPCWGLAESTCVVSGSPQRRRPIIRRFDRAALETGSATEAADDEGSVRLVASGEPLYHHETPIVDPEAARELPDGEIGEIWVRGPCVSPGYWNRPDLTQETFGAHLADGDGPFLRTGDLAFKLDGQLYIVSRSKDIVIIRGRNLAAHDIELTVERCHEAVRPGCSAAFGIERDGDEALAIVAEVVMNGDPVEDVESAVRAAVAEEHGVVPARVALIAPRTIPKTSSGKIRRRASRQALVDGSLDLVNA